MLAVWFSTPGMHQSQGESLFYVPAPPVTAFLLCHAGLRPRADLRPPSKQLSVPQVWLYHEAVMLLGLPGFSSLTVNQPGQGVGMERPSYARNEPGECSRGHIAERLPTHAARSSLRLAGTPGWRALPKPGKRAVGDDLHPLYLHPA